MVTMPNANDLDMWPYVGDDSPLWSLDYAESVSDAMTGKDDTDMPLWHETMGWLFDLCTASYAVAMEVERGHDILAQLDRMQFRMSPLFRDADDLEDDARDAYEYLMTRESATV